MAGNFIQKNLLHVEFEASRFSNQQRCQDEREISSLTWQSLSLMTINLRINMNFLIVFILEYPYIHIYSFVRSTYYA